MIDMKQIIMNCTICGKETILTKHKRLSFLKTGRGYCSKKCSNAYRAKISSITMSRTNKKYAKAFSLRMKKNNPMNNPVIREKVSSKLKAIGHRPHIRGGNGKGPTIHQLALANAIGWDMEVSIKTGMKKGSGMPYVYKIDIANEILKIGVEVDGNSHGTLINQERDKRKTEFLTGLGWKILRFKNIEIERNLEECVNMIMSMI